MTYAAQFRNMIAVDINEKRLEVHREEIQERISPIWNPTFLVLKFVDSYNWSNRVPNTGFKTSLANDFSAVLQTQMKKISYVLLVSCNIDE